MSFSESFTTHGDDAASSLDLVSASFTGQARDLPAPVEFPLPAVQSLAALSSLRSLSERDEPLKEGLDPVAPERPKVTGETAFSLQELATALARPPTVPAALPAARVQADFSLTALAEQLQSRFTPVDREAEGGVDLLAAPSTAATLPADPAGLEKVVPPGSVPLPPSAAVKTVPPAPAFQPSRKSAAPPVPKIATTRQGDVFFMEPPESILEKGKAVESDKVDVFGDGPNGDLMEAVNLLEAPDLRAEFLPVPPPRPVPTPPPLLRASSPARLKSEPPSEAGPGLVLGGAALMVMGIYFACLLPTSWLLLEEADAWTQQKTLAALVLHAAAALGALTLGTGSVMSRRWAPPLIHAAGWVAVFTVSGIIAATGFQLVNADPAAPGPDTAGLIGLFISLLIPLGCILYYQQESTAVACEAANPAPCWTDGLPVPALMVFLTGLALATGAAAMFCHRPAFPVAMDSILTGPAATAAWAGLGALGLATAVLARLKRSASLWLLLLTAVALAALLSPGALTAGTVWENLLDALGRPAGAGPAAPMVPLLTSLIPAPLLLIFAMARRAFSFPPLP